MTTWTPSLVIVGRLTLLLAAASALGLAVTLARGHDRALHGAVVRYACPMHPEVVSSASGDCPICGMALERLGGTASEVAAHSGVVGTAKRLVLATQVRAPASRAADGVVTAILYGDDIVGMAPDAHALFFPGTAPALGIDVRRLAELPVPVDASTSKVRFRSERGARWVGASEDATQVGLLQIEARSREVLVVPASAVLYSKDGPYVLASSAQGGSFTKRPVAIGRILDSSYAAGLPGDSVGAIVVLSGLREGEPIVVGDTFFLDAERRLRLARGQGDSISIAPAGSPAGPGGVSP